MLETTKKESKRIQKWICHLMMTHLKRIALFVLQPTQTVDQMKSGFNALHVKSGPTKSALIYCIQGHLFAEIVIQTTQILIIN